MKINFNQPMTGLDGKPIKTQDENKPIKDADGKVTGYQLTPLMLKTICVNALMSDEQGDDGKAVKIEPVEKVRRFALAQAITMSTKPIDVDIADVTLIKEMIGKAYGTLIVGASYALLPN